MKGKKKLLFVVTVVLSVTIGPFFSAKCLHEEPKKNIGAMSAGPPSASAPSPASPNRPIHGWFGTQLPPLAPPETRSSFESGFRRLSEKTPREYFRGEAVTDEEVLAAFAEAERMILSEEELPHAWKWHETRDAVAQIGVTIPLEMLPPQMHFASEKLLMSYDIAGGRLFMKPDALRGKTPEVLASILVHELTHAVVVDETLRHSSFTRQDLLVLNVHCRDFGFLFNFVSEGLAFSNQAAWIRVHPDALDPSLDGLATILEMAVLAQEGSPEKARAFTFALRRYADVNIGWQYRGQGTREIPPPCGPPVSIRGARAGQFFFPSDIAPDLAVHWLDLAFGKVR